LKKSEDKAYHKLL
jgi:hypothetical protein